MKKEVGQKVGGKRRVTKNKSDKEVGKLGGSEKKSEQEVGKLGGSVGKLVRHFWGEIGHSSLNPSNP